MFLDGVLSAFSKNKKQVIERYKAFISKERDPVSPWQKLKNQIYLGSDEFVDEMKGKSPKCNEDHSPKQSITTKKSF